MITPMQAQKKSQAQSDAQDHFVNSAVDGRRVTLPTGGERPNSPTGGILIGGGAMGSGMTNKLG